MKNPETKLRNALKANASFSFASGAILIAFNVPISKLMNINDDSVLLFIGIALLVFVAFLLTNALRKKLNYKQIQLIIYQDLAWVMGSAVLVSWRPFNISMIGNVLIAIVAIIVLSLAIVQSRVLKHTKGKNVDLP